MASGGTLQKNESDRDARKLRYRPYAACAHCRGTLSRIPSTAQLSNAIVFTPKLLAPCCSVRLEALAVSAWQAWHKHGPPYAINCKHNGLEFTETAAAVTNPPGRGGGGTPSYWYKV